MSPFLIIEVLKACRNVPLELNVKSIDMNKQNKIPLFICYSTQKSDISAVVGLENIF